MSIYQNKCILFELWKRPLILVVKSRSKSSECVTSISLHVHTVRTMKYAASDSALWVILNCWSMNYSSSPPSLLFTSPPRPGWPLLQQTATAQLTLKQRVFTSDRLGGQPISALSCANCLMLRSWTKTNPLLFFFSFIVLKTCATTAGTRSNKNKIMNPRPSRRSGGNLQAGLCSLSAFYFPDW